MGSVIEGASKEQSEWVEVLGSSVGGSSRVEVSDSATFFLGGSPDSVERAVGCTTSIVTSAVVEGSVRFFFELTFFHAQLLE